MLPLPADLQCLCRACLACLALLESPAIELHGPEAGPQHPVFRNGACRERLRRATER